MSNGTQKPIPKFKTEAQERAYWESHDSSDHVDWSKAQKAKLPNWLSNALDPVTTDRSQSAQEDTAH